MKNHKRTTRLLCTLLILCGILYNYNVYAQTDSSRLPVKHYRIGIFAPLYLDSAVSGDGTFRLKDQLPKYMLPGLDFVHGAEIALDSMSLFEENLDAYIFDTKSSDTPLTTLIGSHKLDSMDLLIGSVKDNELRLLADFAQQKHIPLVSATYPNDGGITRNPFLILVTSTLRAHCEAIYSYILQNHGPDKIFLCRKKGMQEDKVASYFRSLNEPDGRKLLTIQTISFDSAVTTTALLPLLDSNRHTVLIGGSLDETFATALAQSASQLHGKYPLTLIGMPNWDGFRVFSKKDELEDLPVYITSPYFNAKTDSYSRIVLNGYGKRFKGKPSDFAYKGFECTYLFTKLLVNHPNDLINHLDDKTFRLFTDFNFRPVMLTPGYTTPDYFENKHLYFIKMLNGTPSKAW